MVVKMQQKQSQVWLIKLIIFIELILFRGLAGGSSQWFGLMFGFTIIPVGHFPKTWQETLIQSDNRGVHGRSQRGQQVKQIIVLLQNQHFFQNDFAPLTLQLTSNKQRRDKRRNHVLGMDYWSNPLTSAAFLSGFDWTQNTVFFRFSLPSAPQRCYLTGWSRVYASSAHSGTSRPSQHTENFYHHLTPPFRVRQAENRSPKVKHLE